MLNRDNGLYTNPIMAIKIHIANILLFLLSDIGTNCLLPKGFVKTHPSKMYQDITRNQMHII
jgi:hypothetical protein